MIATKLYSTLFLSLACVLSTECNAFLTPKPRVHKASTKGHQETQNTIKKVASVDEELSIENPNRRASSRKRWGIDNQQAAEYWYDQRIHSFGNIGLGGGLHAAVAPMATRRIDDVAYDGVDLRLHVANELRDLVKKQQARILDMCCGVGMSTRALHQAFPDAQQIMGLDTSPQMVAMANFVTNHLQTMTPFFRAVKSAIVTLYTKLREHGKKWEEKAAENRANFKGIKFFKGNAEDTKLPSTSFDLITVMYAFHEAPHEGRSEIIHEARRLLSPGGVLAVVDITTDYEPSPAMLAGEPYVLEYQQNIHRQLRNMKGFKFSEYRTLVPGHVGMWILRRMANPV